MYYISWIKQMIGIKYISLPEEASPYHSFNTCDLNCKSSLRFAMSKTLSAATKE